MLSARFKEPAMKGHLPCRDILSSMLDVSLEDRIHCIVNGYVLGVDLGNSLTGSGDNTPVNIDNILCLVGYHFVLAK